MEVPGVLERRCCRLLPVCRDALLMLPLAGTCTDTSTCAAVDCPDGGIGWQGVYVNGGSKNYCVAWDSVSARLGLLYCTPDKKTCTKLAARHGNSMTTGAGVLVMKRTHCEEDHKCTIFKVTTPCHAMTIQGVTPLHMLLCYDVRPACASTSGRGSSRILKTP